MSAVENQPRLFSDGHFYSPIADLDDIKAREESIWRSNKIMAGIEWREDSQLRLLQDFSGYVPEIGFPVEKQDNPSTYYYSNDQFPILDAEVLYCILRYFKPHQMIEVGSGFSSLVTAYVNRVHSGGSLQFICIEPYPRQFLLDGVPGISELVVSKVQDVQMNFYDRLQEGDILFIDSSHVTKVGSDVNHLFFEVIPRLREGVLIHIHDIFLPDEYPKQWVIEEGRHWNEQYLVRAFLEFNASFEIIWASYFMAKYHGAEVKARFPRFPELGGGGSLWLRKTA
jgi:predicted O-methyltransferase YrrM